MTKQTQIPIYSEQELLPRHAEVIQAILKDRFEKGSVKLVEAIEGVHKKVLVCGKAPNWKNTEFVYTYSLAQILSKSNAATVLEAGIKQFLEPPEVPEFPPGWDAENGTEDNLLADIDPMKPVSIDIETSGNITGSDTPEDVELISIAFLGYNDNGFLTTKVFDKEDIAAYNTLIKTFLKLCNKIIGHNFKFDSRVIYNCLGVRVDPWFDTMLAHHVLNQGAGSHGLKDLARRYCGAEDWDAGAKKYTRGKGKTYEDIPTEELLLYNAWDVYWTLQLWEYLSPQIEADENAQRAFALELEASRFLLNVELRGLPVDLDYCDTFGKELQDKADSAFSTIKSIPGVPRDFNPRSPKQVKEVFALLGRNVTSTGEETVIEEMNKDTSDDNVVSFCSNLLKYRKALKMKSVYVDGIKSRTRNGRVHATYKIHGTATGRLSSSNPNVQNIPRDTTVRRIFAL